MSDQPALSPSPIVPEPHKGKLLSGKNILMVVIILTVLAGTAAAAWYIGRMQTAGTANTNTANSTKDATGTTSTTTQSATAKGELTLDTSKNYGDKYANGILPVGDNKYTTSGGKKGYIYMCNSNFVPTSQAGAQTRGPWFVNNNQSWDINKKVSVKGSVTHTPHTFNNALSGDTRTITTNDFPDHITGVFPIQSSDPAYAYDRNPGTITAQNLSYKLTAYPSYGAAQCMGGEVGIMLTGTPIFNGFDAGGRDAGAWEVQDGCDGHPQNKGEYHYHTLSRCIKDTGVSTVIGFALDGFPITGPKVGNKNILTTSDLDDCHGITSEIMLDGKKVTSYHYVMTQDFPYSVSCFRAKAIQPPGQSEFSSGGTSGGNQQPSMPPPPRR